MNFIDELLKNEKVEWNKLGEVCEIKRGRVISKKYLEIHQGEYPVYSSQTRDNGKIGSINTYDFDGEYVTWTTDGAYAGTIFYRSGKFSVTNICGLIFPKDKNILNLKFVFYWLQITAKKYVKDGSGNPKLMSNVMGNITIPISSLETQEKIVKILDNFTKYVTELQAELQAKNKQYEYYRNMLLSQEWIEKEEGEEVEWKALEEIFDTRTGYTPSKKIKLYWENGTVDWFTIEDINQKGKNLETANVKISETGVKGKLFKGNSVVLSTNASVGKYALIKNDFTINQRFMVFTAKKEYSDFLNMEFAKYYFSQISEYCLKNLREGKFPSVDLKKLLKFKFPIPSLKTQQKIVNILDSFETLVNDIKQGLPREIELRQKQYEYYREKLLTFN